MRGGGLEGKPKETYQQYALDCSEEEDCMGNYKVYLRKWARANPQAVMEENMSNNEFSQYRKQQGQIAYNNGLVADRSRVQQSPPKRFGFFGGRKGRKTKKSRKAKKSRKTKKRC
jgi:hypothetical protein